MNILILGGSGILSTDFTKTCLDKGNVVYTLNRGNRRIELYKNNLVTLLNSGKPVVFRLPVIGGYTDSEENRKAVVELIESKAKSYSNLLKIEILKEHNLGTNKYQSLIDGGNEIMLPEYNGVSDELMGQYKIEIEEGLMIVGSSIPVEICKI